MAQAFDDTLRALRADRSRGIGATIALLIGTAWIVWLIGARVPLYRTSERAHLEVLPSPTRVATVSAGRLVAVHLQLGARVAAGDVLVELDLQAETLALEQARGQLAALDPELASLDREIEAEATAVTAGQSSGRSSVREQIARQRAADADLAHAEAELARATALVADGASPRADLDRAKVEVDVKRAEREARGHASDEVTAGGRERDAGRRLRVAELERQRAQVGGTMAAAKAEVARLALEIERRVVRAPVAGVLGSVSTLQPGAVVGAGDAIATIVPDGALQIVAEYGPSAIGRLGPGQRGRIRLDGFPWTRWGTVPLHVTSVGNEVRDGRIRVELAIEPGTHQMSLVHGMTGSVDIEVEHASPATLVLRSIVDRPTDVR